MARHSAFDEIRGAPAIPDHVLEHDDEILQFVRDNVQTTYHPAGTCKMGHDAHAVVDDELRVRGVEGLRVIDCSITPTIPSGNTNAPVIAFAEKASDMIRGRPPLPPWTAPERNAGGPGDDLSGDRPHG